MKPLTLKKAASISTLRVRNARPILAFIIAATALTPNLHATTTNSIWSGTVNSNWSNAANWSPSTAFPNNGNGGVSDYVVTINSAPTAPTLDVAATIDTLTLTANASLAINSGISLTLTGLPLSNAGAITLAGNSTIGTSSLSLAGGGITLLSGGGTITLTDSTFSRISGGNLTNVDNTIQGAGIILAPITNQAILRASAGTLSLNSAVNNAAGNVTVAADGILSVSSTLSGGTLATVSGSQVIGGGTLQNVTLNASSVWNILSGTSSPQIAGTFTNNGNISLAGNSTIGVSSFSLASTGTTTLSGGGTLTLTDSTFSRISGGNLTNVNNTIQGAGTILAAITNQAAIRASAGTLSLNSNVDNSAGNVAVAANGILSIGATLTGGTLATVAGSQVIGGGTLKNVTLSAGSLWNIPSGISSPQLAGTLTNNGNISVSGNSTIGTATFLVSAGTTSLSGGGTITLTDPTFSRISGGNLTNVNNTLQGAGTILAIITNQGIIRASNGSLSLNSNVDNTSGNLAITANGTLTVNATITGGPLSTIAGSQIGGSGTLSSVTISGNSSLISSTQLNNVTLTGQLTVQPNAAPQISGTFVDAGTVTLLGTNTIGSASLTLPSTGTTFLTGNGTVTLTDSTFSRITTGNLTNVEDIIRGAGTISATITNQASILAENGILSLNSNVDNSAGDILVFATGTLSVGATITGGTIFTDAGAQMLGGGTLNHVTLDTGSVWNIRSGTTSPLLAGNFTNKAAISLSGNATIGSAILTLTSGQITTLNGGGTITLTDSTFSRITGGSLTNIDNTIQGAGTITSAVNNQATIHASGGNLTFTASVTGNGTALVDAGAALNVGNFTQSTLTNNGSFSMTGNGTIASITGSGSLILSNSHLSIPSGSPTVHQTDLTPTGLNALDLTNNKIVLQSTASAKTALITKLEHAVVAGSIISSTRPANFAIAIIDNGGFPQPLSTFGGLPVDSNSVLISQELLGDANLDGIVNISDLNTLAAHWQQTGADWSRADFNADGIVNIADLNIIAANWQAQAGTGSSSLSALPTILPTQSTPEPASLAILLFGTALLTRRRV